MSTIVDKRKSLPAIFPVAERLVCWRSCRNAAYILFDLLGKASITWTRKSFAVPYAFSQLRLSACRLHTRNFSSRSYLASSSEH